MRLSANPGDPGYRAYQSLGKRKHLVRVFVDGIEQHYVVTADTKRSCVTVFQRDENGRFSINRKRGTARMTRIAGSVEIRMA